jgi:hypothetical protein
MSGSQASARPPASNTIRFAKQALGWTTPKIRNPVREA